VGCRLRLGRQAEDVPLLMAMAVKVAEEGA
jgi:hypothetical protein